MTVKIRIKVLRAIKEITQAELSEKTGINQSAISEIESGKRSASIKMLERIAKGLDCKISDLIEE